ncbi:MAG: hypothetical protein PF692_15745 [Kiritimatiellae bacterium]|jgi:hypothetical protein|nr:hypothetical protein [Kiritimatiellia bacterium]
MKKMLEMIGIVVLTATFAKAELFLSENFDYTLGTSLDTETGGSGTWGANAWTNVITNIVSRGTEEIVDGLQFGRLETSGNAWQSTSSNTKLIRFARLTNFANSSRGDDAWLTYIIHYTGPTSSSAYQEQNVGNRFTNGSVDPIDQKNDAYRFGVRFLDAGTWDTVLNTQAIINSDAKDSVTIPVVSDSTYMVVVGMLNMKLPSYSGSYATTNKVWILTEDNFNNLCKSEFSFDSLNANNLTNVQRVAYGDWGTYGLESDYYFMFDNYLTSGSSSICTFDEIRIGGTLADVLPLKPAGTVLIVL